MNNMLTIKNLATALEVSDCWSHSTDPNFLPQLHFGQLVGRRAAALDWHGRPIVNGLGRNYHMCWEFVFEAPPAVSALYAVSGFRDRALLSSVQCQAMGHTLDVLEQLVAPMVSGEEARSAAGLVGLALIHDTQDTFHPGIHGHLLVYERTPAGTKQGTLLNSYLHPQHSPQYLPFLEAVYHCQMDGLLVNGLGLHAQRRGDTYTIAGLPEKLVQALCSGREAHTFREWASILATRASDWISRGGKNHPGPDSPPVRYERWAAIACEWGFSQKQAAALMPFSSMPLRDWTTLSDMIFKGSYLPLGEARQAALHSLLDRAAARVSLEGHNLSAPHITHALAELCEEEHLAPMPMAQAVQGFIAEHQLTETNAPRQSRLVQDELSHEDASLAGRLTWDAFTRTGIALDADQITALTRLVKAPGHIKVLEGFSQDRMEQILQEAHVQWSRHPDGYSVVITSAMPGHELDLDARTGIRCVRLDGVLQSSSTFELRRGILVVEGAQQCSPRILARLIERVKDVEATLVLAYADAPSPIPPLPAPQEARTLDPHASERLPRQDRAPSAPQSREDSLVALVRQWRREGVADPPSHVILAAREDDVRELNRLAQAERRDAGALGQDYVTVNGTPIHTHDRVLFTEACPVLGISPDTAGSVCAALPGLNCLLVEMGDGRVKPVLIQDFQGLQLGYALLEGLQQGTQTPIHYEGDPHQHMLAASPLAPESEPELDHDLDIDLEL